MTAMPPSPPAMPSPAEPAPGRPLAPPFVAIVGYTLRACLPLKRWLGVLFPCLGALVFGWLSTMLDDDPTVIDTDATGPTLVSLADESNFADVAELGLFALVLPLVCLVIGDAVLGADLRAGTFQLTWLSPVHFATVAAGRWLGGWLVALVTVVPALAIAPVIAGVPDAVGPVALAAAVGSAAYLALFMMIGVVTRRSALWSLAVVLLGEWLLGTNLSGVAQISPRWESQQMFVGLWDYGEFIERDGMPVGWAAAVRLLLVGAVCLGIATWRLGRMRPFGSAD